MCKPYVVRIGSTSRPKISAVIRAFGQYPELWDGHEAVQFVAVPPESDSNVSSQPRNMDEIFRGATNRAKHAYDQARADPGSVKFGVGLEAGVFPVPSKPDDHKPPGYMNVSVAAIYDGKQYCYGGSPLFEYPDQMLDVILSGQEAGSLSDLLGSTVEDLKGRPGVIAPLTDGRMTRDRFDELAVLMALTRIVRDNLY